MNTKGHESALAEVRLAKRILWSRLGGDWRSRREAGNCTSLFVWLRVPSWLNGILSAESDLMRQRASDAGSAATFAGSIFI